MHELNSKNRLVQHLRPTYCQGMSYMLDAFASIFTTSINIQLYCTSGRTKKNVGPMFEVIEKQKQNKKRFQKNVDPTSYNIARKCTQHFQPMLHDIGPKC